MATFVIVHGGWGGGWEWSPVADILRRHGHRAGSVPEAVRQAYLDRIRAHPAASFTEPIHLTDALESVPRAFVRCTAGAYAEEAGGDPVAAGAAHALAAGWTYREIGTPHDPQVFDAEGIARLMIDLAT
jgi:hypothetical protein